MSELENSTTDIDNNVQKKPKSTSKRLNAFERAQREGEEYLKSLGASLEDSGRRTRRSTRDQSSTPSTPSTAELKRKQYSTPRRSKKTKLETADQTDSGNHVEQNDKVEAQVEVGEASLSIADKSEKGNEKLNDEPAQAIQSTQNEIIEDKMVVDDAEEAQPTDNCAPETQNTNESQAVNESAAQTEAQVIVESSPEPEPEPEPEAETETEILPIESEPVAETALPAQIIEDSPAPSVSVAADTTKVAPSPSINIDEPKENDVPNEDNNVIDAEAVESKAIEKTPAEEIAECNQSSSDSKNSLPSSNVIEGSTSIFKLDYPPIPIKTNDAKKNSVHSVDEKLSPASQSNNDGKILVNAETTVTTTSDTIAASGTA